MVLSNKKLKQKLKAQKTCMYTPPPTKTQQKETKPISLIDLLDSATKEKRTKWREKLRVKKATFSSENNDNDDNPDGKSGVEKEGDGKKRKRESGVVEIGDDDGVMVVRVSERKEKNKEKKKRMKRNEKKRKEKELRKIEAGGLVVVPGGGSNDNNVGEISKTGVVDDMGDFSNSQGKVEDKKKVYVGGIPYYSTEDDIRSYFDQCGTITEIDCLTFPDSGKFRGIAVISFKTEEAAKRALAFDGSEMGGLYLKIQLYKTTRLTKASSDFCPPVVEGYNRIYVGNLSWDITEEDLRKLFYDCNVSAIRFGEDKETGEFKGYAHVDFADSASLTKALQLDQRVVCGRPVRISCAVAKRDGKGNLVPAADRGAKTKEAPAAENVAETKEVPEAETGVVMNEIPAAVTTEVDTHYEGVASLEDNSSGVPLGKLKRRTCYECGEKGHISSACPKKQV